MYSYKHIFISIAGESNNALAMSTNFQHMFICSKQLPTYRWVEIKMCYLCHMYYRIQTWSRFVFTTYKFDIRHECYLLVSDAKKTQFLEKTNLWNRWKIMKKKKHFCLMKFKIWNVRYFQHLHAYFKWFYKSNSKGLRQEKLSKIMI